jgi:CRP-like cAMP-binding protein
MPEPKEDFAPFLKRVFIFSGMSDDRLARLAEQVEAVSLEEGMHVYSEGDLADDFYIMLDGRIRLSTGSGSQKKDWDTLIPTDFFGEDQLLATYRTGTAGLTPSRALRLGGKISWLCSKKILN